MIIKPLFTVEKTGFKGSGNPTGPGLCSASDSCQPESWLLGAWGLKGGYPHVIPDTVAGASTRTHRLTATLCYPRMGIMNSWGKKGPERCSHLPKVTELLGGRAWTLANSPSLPPTWLSSTSWPQPS